MKRTDEAAFAAFVAAHGVALLRTARRLVGDPHEAEDLLQVALLRTATSWSKVASPAAYARSALVTLACDRSRRAHLVPRPVERPTAETTSDPGGSGHGSLSGRLEQRETLEEWLAVLTEAQRVAVVLHILEGMTAAEIGRHSGQPVATVRSHLARGMAALRARARVTQSQPQEQTR